MNLITSSCHSSTRLFCDSAFIPPPLRVSMAMSLNTAAFPFYPRPFLHIPPRPFIALAKKKNPQSEPVINPSIIEELAMVNDEEDDDIFLEDFDDDELVDDDGYFEDEYFAEEAEPSAGDGAGGGGISLAGTLWDKRALEIAEEVTLSFDGELGIYAFKTLLNATTQVRVERLTNKSGSPTMADIEAFSTRFREGLMKLKLLDPFLETYL